MVFVGLNCVEIAAAISALRIQRFLNCYQITKFRFALQKILAVFLQIVVETAESGFHLLKYYFAG